MGLQRTTNWCTLGRLNLTLAVVQENGMTTKAHQQTQERMAAHFLNKLQVIICSF